jgi:hypothetical protein
MASTFENNLRLEEIGTGEQSGTWGTKTNVNLELITDGLSYSSTGEAIANASTHTITMADGVADEFRSFYLKCTGGGQACTVTLAPNTLSKVWVIENTTSYTLTFSQGSGANVAILAGQVKMIATDGAGSGAAVFDLMQDLAVPDLFVDDDLKLQSDGAVLGFGADNDVTLTHVADTGLLLNSTMAIQFNDASQFINAPSATVLDINATDEIELNATLVDINANLDVSGTITGTGTSVFASLDISGDIDVDGTTNLDVVDIDGAVQIDNTVTVGVDDTGYDVKFFGASASHFLLWDESADELVLAADSKLSFNDAAGGENIVASADGHLEVNAGTTLDVTAPTVQVNASSVFDVNGNIDVSGTYTGGGLMTTGGNIVIPDAGNIGSASDTDAIAIASDGQVTLTQTLTGTAANFSGVATATTFEPDGDTAAGDNAAIGYTAAEGLILTGQGSTNDVTIKNDADADVLEIPTGTTNVTIAGNLGVGGTVTGTGTSVFASLDISGDIDVDGTTNLDVVDIDGAVDMASTLNVSGITDFGSYQGSSINSPVNVKSDANHHGLSIEENSGTETWQLGVDVDGDLNFHNSGNATPSVTFDDSGNVGIGTSTIGDKLVVQGASSATASIVIQDPTADDHGTHLSYDDANSKAIFGGLTNGTKNPALSVARDAANGIEIDSSGRVGIGETTLSTPLTVKGANETTFDGVSTLELKGTNAFDSGDAGAGIVFAGIYDSSSNVTALAQISGKKASTVSGEYDGVLTFGVRNDAEGVNIERMRITSAGNVGIGITPSTKLTVFGSGAGNATVQIEGESGADPFINFLANNTQHWSLGIDDSDSDKFKLSEHSALGTNDYFVVDVTGNVGIGTSSPSAQLHISGTDTSDQVIIENTDTGGGSAPDLVLFRNSASPADNDVIGRIDYRGDDDNGTARDYVTLFSTITDASTATPAGSFAIQTRNGSSQDTRLIVDGSGKVGINETSPDRHLHVKSGSDNVVAKFESTDSVASIEFVDSGGGSAEIGGEGNQIVFFPGGADKGRINADGKFLIGNSSSQVTDLLQIESPASGGGHGIAIRRNDNNTDQQLGRIMFGNTVDSDIGQIHVKTTGATNTGAMIFSTASSGTTSEAMRINSSGNVIIGNSTSTLTTATLGSTNTFLELQGLSTSSGTIVLSRDADANDEEIGGIRFANRNNADDTNLDADGKLVAAISARAITSDSNAGDDSGADLTFSTKPEAGNFAERMRIASTGTVTINPDLTGSITPLIVKGGRSSSTTLLSLETDGTGQSNDTIQLDFKMNSGADATERVAGRIAVQNVTTSAARGRMIFSVLEDAGNLKEAMRIDDDGEVLIGHTSPITTVDSQKLQLIGTTSSDGLSIARFNADFGPYLNFGRSGSDTIGTMTAVPSGDELGRIQWGVADGTDMNSVGASISAFTEQTAASNDVPSRLVFATTADNASTPTERMRIDSSGNITAPTTAAFLATPASVQSNIPINTTTTIVLGTEVFDQGSNFASNTFTAPVTGKYQLCLQVGMQNLDTVTAYYQLDIVTSNRTFQFLYDPTERTGDVTYATFIVSALADMDASDTAFARLYLPNSGAAQADVNTGTYFSGFLAC